MWRGFELWEDTIASEIRQSLRNRVAANVRTRVRHVLSKTACFAECGANTQTRSGCGGKFSVTLTAPW